jgi:hypothetical protein
LSYGKFSTKSIVFEYHLIEKKSIKRNTQKLAAQSYQPTATSQKLHPCGLLKLKKIY